MRFDFGRESETYNDKQQAPVAQDGAYTEWHVRFHRYRLGVAQGRNGQERHAVYKEPLEPIIEAFRRSICDSFATVSNYQLRADASTLKSRGKERHASYS